MSDPADLSLIEAADAIAARKLSSVELTASAIARAGETSLARPSR